MSLTEPSTRPSRRPTDESGQRVVGDDTLITEATTSVLWREMPDGLLLVSEGAVVAANPSAEELFGYEQQALVGTPVEDLVPAHLESAHRAWRENYRRQPRKRVMTSSRTFAARHRDGTSIPTRINLTPLGPPSDLVLAIVRDVSDLVSAEARASENQVAAAKHETAIQHLFAAGIALRGATRMADESSADQLNHTIDMLDEVLAELTAQAVESPPRERR